jgi:hypothetical protein
MASRETCEKVCWWTKAGHCLDLILPLTPQSGALKNKEKK